MHGQRGDAGILGDARDVQRVAVLAVPAGADLQRDRNIHRLHHGLHDARDQRFVLEQGGARPDVADLLRRAAHVDVDDLRAVVRVVLRRLGQHAGIVAGDLHAHRLRLALVVHPAQRLGGVPQARIGRGHLGHGQARPQALAQEAEGLVGDAGHGREHHGRCDGVGTDAHGIDFTRFAQCIPSMAASASGEDAEADHRHGDRHQQAHGQGPAQHRQRRQAHRG